MLLALCHRVPLAYLQLLCSQGSCVKRMIWQPLTGEIKRKSVIPEFGCYCIVAVWATVFPLSSSPSHNVSSYF